MDGIDTQEAVIVLTAANSTNSFDRVLMVLLLQMMIPALAVTKEKLLLVISFSVLSLVSLHATLFSWSIHISGRSRVCAHTHTPMCVCTYMHTHTSTSVLL